ncbi:MAG TPA: hypothetical protein VKH43_08190 [Thermoanaerobaculia bacterium]|nr:hypothetical protein [Thermoanaerobaculia bacterium]
MTPLNPPGRSNRIAFVVLFVTLLVAGLEIWGIRSALGSLLK